MPRPVAVLGVLFSLMAPFCARAAERSVAGQLKSPDAWKTLGRQGCLAIPSRARWEAIEKLLTGLGWEKPAPDPLVAVDFAREQIVCLFRSGDQSDRFSVHRLTLDSKHAELAAVMSYVIYRRPTRRSSNGAQPSRPTRATSWTACGASSASRSPPASPASTCNRRAKRRISARKPKCPSGAATWRRTAFK